MTPQRRAVVAHRQRLGQRGLARYEVRGLARDKELVRQFAKRLAANDAEAERLRQTVAGDIAEWPRTGRDILEALRRSPLAGADLNFEREVVPPRDIDI